MTDPEQALKDMHARFCALTGTTQKYIVHRGTWLAFWQAGYTLADLDLVVPYVLRRNQQNAGKWQYSTHIRILIGDLEKFDDLLADAEAQRERKAKLGRVDQNRNRVLEATGREPVPNGTLQTPRESLNRLGDQLKNIAKGKPCQ